MRYPQIAAKVFDRPLLIDQRKLNIILGVLGPRLGFEMQGAGVSPPLALASDGGGSRPALPPPAPTVALIPIHGTLMHRPSGMDVESGATGYDMLDATFRAALFDDRVTSIVLDVDSPGGEVAGVFDLAETIYQARGIKPITAIVNDWACSAAYLLASAADEVVTSRTGEVGSVGVVMTHMDVTGANQQRGIVVTQIYAGDHKIDFTPYRPLSEDARERMQGEVDRIYSMFVDTVARNRGLSADSVRATQALTYMGEDGVNVGFADRVGSLAAVIRDHTSETSRGVVIQGSARGDAGAARSLETDSMSNAANAGGNPAPNTPEGVDVKAAETAAAKQAVERVRSILSHDDAKGREAMANHLAYDTNLSAADAIALLGKAPTAAAKSDAPSFDKRMAGTNPDIGADGATGGGVTDEAKEAAAIVASLPNLRRA